MTRVAGSKLFGMFVACVLSLGEAVAIAGDKAAATAAKPDQEAVDKWLDRSEKFAASLPEKQLAEVLVTICGPMVVANREDHIDRLLATIKDPERRKTQEYYICVALSNAGKYGTAIRRAQSLPAEPRKAPSGEKLNSSRAGALFAVARLQFSAYDFEEGKKTMGLIDDPQVVSTAHSRLAEYLAKAGLYTDAEESLKKVVATTEDEKEYKENTRKLIARYKAAGEKDPPRIQTTNLYESVRRLSTIFCDSGLKLNSVAQAEIAEKMAENEKEANDKASAWREIAWAYYDMRNADKNNLERCRRAIDKSLENAKIIPDGHGTTYMRAVAFASAANLYLELGETDLAKKAILKADAVNLDEDLLGGLSGITTTPLLISVLVRIGDIGGGRNIAEKIQKSAEKNGEKDAMSSGAADIAWGFWSTVCTLEGKTSCVESQIEKTKDARIKAILCAGVASGLLELQQRTANTKP